MKSRNSLAGRNFVAELIRCANDNPAMFTFAIWSRFSPPVFPNVSSAVSFCSYHASVLHKSSFLCLKFGKLPAGLAGTIQAQIVDEEWQKPQQIEESYRFPAAIPKYGTQLKEKGSRNDREDAPSQPFTQLIREKSAITRLANEACLLEHCLVTPKDVESSARHRKAVEGPGSQFESVCGAVVELVRTLPAPQQAGAPVPSSRHFCRLAREAVAAGAAD